MGVLEAVLVAVHAVGRGASLVELASSVREHEPDVDLRVLLFDQQVFRPVTDSPDALSLDIKKAPRLGELEVWGISGVSGRNRIAYLVGLILNLKSVVFYLLCYALL